MSTKSRRPLATPMGMQTPKRKTVKSKSAQQAILDNFDLEVADRTRMMRQQLELALSTFLAQVDADMLKIPRSMRGMTLGELDACWAGSFVATSRAIAQKQFAEQHPERDQAETLELAKRKRESPLESPRNSKNPRTTTPAVKRRTTKSLKKRKLDLPSATGASTLPQDHVFAPRIPQTPRAPRRNESFFSQNGSPVDPTVVPDDDLPGRGRGGGRVDSFRPIRPQPVAEHALRRLGPVGTDDAAQALAPLPPERG
ncbi:hypothetical protein A1Q1_01300 [Trichosporon asahii var. asahii CBS 2479]|uniref:Uncharacterized protein n=1 Tax=Trichosporon asahii var. asahii (strain ATCC 90039 / CBS 2479 / JCM 2466 / KCTC 7840 / NBRC 103889/ NCYC 2677 / UAMH 7654) TaxID=1186058 RepID=J5T7C9_TRIAS|nr:hypothetical protein A1Q1_01300 [Trichosporon asahii var. asahii CBS 2479]EJT49556.1 hypothetical protein A1Q1_01300 [Trichosporon asahii var. asahii CBS 2479]